MKSKFPGWKNGLAFWAHVCVVICWVVRITYPSRILPPVSIPALQDLILVFSQSLDEQNPLLDKKDTLTVDLRAQRCCVRSGSSLLLT